jgi:hypothetical protein
MVIVPASKESEAGVLPDTKILAEMGKFNEELVKAGLLLAAEGLQPTSKGKRVKFSGSTPTVIDGPFTEDERGVPDSPGGKDPVGWDLMIGILGLGELGKDSDCAQAVGTLEFRWRKRRPGNGGCGADVGLSSRLGERREAPKQIGRHFHLNAGRSAKREISIVQRA